MPTDPAADERIPFTLDPRFDVDADEGDTLDNDAHRFNARTTLDRKLDKRSLKLAREALEGLDKPKTKRVAKARRVGYSFLERELDRELNRIISPEAPEGVAQASAPPVMTPDLWAQMCGVGDRPVCKDRGFKGELCWACEWGKSCELYLRVLPWKKELRVEHVRVFRWANVYGAIRTYAEHALHGQAPPSALGPILDNIETGAIRIRTGGSSHSSTTKEDRIMVSGDDLVPVLRALSAAYDGNRWGLPYAECVAVLIARDGGVATGAGGKAPTYEEIGAVCKLPPKMLRDVAAHGRKQLTIELCAREMLPMPARHVGMHVEIDARRQQMASGNNQQGGG